MSEKLSKVDLIGASVMLLVFHAVLALLNGAHTGLLLDTDAYMWLNRVLFLHQDGSWFNSVYPRINPPLGHEQHWTRPFDLLLYSGGWVASLFTDFKTGLHIWAVMLGPLLSVATLLALLWALRPLFIQQQSEALGILFTAQAALLATFLAGRSDHQILLTFLTVLHIGLITRLLLQRFQPSAALAAGVVAAIALWVSIESVLIVSISFTALVIAWCRDNREYGRKLHYYALSLLVTLFFALLLEEGIRGFTATMYDQISVFYLVAAALNLLLWLSVNKVAQRYPLRSVTRLALLAFSAAVAAALLQWLFPGFLQGPLQSVDSLYRAVRLEHISELQPVISIDAMQKQGWWPSMSRFIFWLGIALPALPMLFSRIVASNWPER
ncbi:MAG: hypothetical protein OQK40_00315, partial [Gammaproteobacteria bacterium]|nr:hypothetical protein [Gammaproteobacteria bacterium]MCW8927245.1 hypothetical protein [Gammaproteobacteria bacterium]